MNNNKPGNALGYRSEAHSSSHSVSPKQAPLTTEQRRATGAQPSAQKAQPPARNAAQTQAARKAQPARNAAQTKAANKTQSKSAKSGTPNHPVVPAPSAQLSITELRNAIYWSEILAKPKYVESRARRRAIAQRAAEARGKACTEPTAPKGVDEMADAVETVGMAEKLEEVDACPIAEDANGESAENE